MKKNIKLLTFNTQLCNLCNWPLVLECKLDSMSSILVSLSHDLLVKLIIYVTGYIKLRRRICHLPCRKLNHQNFTASLVSLFALSNPMWLIPKHVSLHLHPYRWESPIPSSVLACTTRTKRGVLGLGGTDGVGGCIFVVD